MMQQQRAATEQPGHYGERKAGKRTRRKATEQASVRLDPAFEQGGEAAGDQLGMIARHGNKPIRCDVERHHCDVSRRIAAALDLWRQFRRGMLQQVVERDHAVRQIAAKAADMTDRKDLGRDLHRRGTGIEAPIREVVIMALPLAWPSARPMSARRHNSGSGTAIMPARSTPRIVNTLSIVLASWMPTTASVCRPSARIRAAIA